jgi:hypothetical protein
MYYFWNVELLAAMVMVLEDVFLDDLLLVQFHGRR